MEGARSNARFQDLLLGRGADSAVGVPVVIGLRPLAIMRRASHSLPQAIRYTTSAHLALRRPKIVSRKAAGSV